MHARRLKNMQRLLAAATASAGIEPGVVDTALALPPATARTTSSRCNALRNRWSLNGSGLKPHAKPARRSFMPLYGVVAVGLFRVGRGAGAAMHAHRTRRCK